MRSTLFAAIFSLSMLFAFVAPSSGHESDVTHVHTTDIAQVTSNLVVQGTITTTHKLGNSAIVNQTPVWEGQTYTFNSETGKIVARTKHDAENGLPALTITKVENGKVTFTYTAKDLKGPLTIRKTLKPRTSRK